MSKHHVETNPSLMRSVLEAEVQKNPQWWKLISNTTKMPGSEGGDSRAVCTRRYQLFVFGRPTDVCIKFFYDYRTNRSSMDFDPLAEKVLQHSVKGDYDEKIIAERLGMKVPDLRMEINSDCLAIYHERIFTRICDLLGLR